MKTTHYLLLILILLLIRLQPAISQPYVDGGKTRHRFAQTHFGILQRYFPGTSGSLSYPGGLMEPLADLHETRLIIGGMHFWGHADFLLTIPVYRSRREGYASGVETAFRYFPWRVRDQVVRPFAGVALSSSRFRKGEGAALSWQDVPLSAGLMYQRGAWLLEGSATWNPQRNRTYYTGRDELATLQAPAWQFSLGLKWLFDSTLSAEKDWKSGRTAILTDTLAKLKRLNGWTLAIGPSSAFYMKDAGTNTSLFPYLHQHKSARIFPEFGLGYYWHKPDLQVNLAYRHMHSEQKAFDETQRAGRRSLTLEGYRFLADYHGFVPFAGLHLSLENLRLTQTGQTDLQRTLVRPGITFGWDIRPNRIQLFYLRTNLRWTPALYLSHASGQRFHFDQLEFNFIQFVLFPGRLF
jgi:hypothetical protein